MSESAAVFEMMRYRTPAPHVVIIDDQSTGRMVLAEIMRLVDPRIKTLCFGNAEEAIEHVRANPVDMVITDYMMPRINGVEAARTLRRYYPVHELPIVMTTIVHSRELVYRAFEAGINDYLLRPIDPIECRLRFEKMLDIRNHFLLQQREIAILNKQLEQTGDALRESGDEQLRRLLAFDQLYDRESKRMEQDVPLYACMIARELGCSEDEVEALRVAASLHDVGMLALPSSLWAQDGRLTEEQMAQMQRHTTLGHELLAGSSLPLARLAAELALNHHERLDGSGYPRGLRGAEISRMARIVAVADVFNALVSERHYRPAMLADEALACMSRQMAGKLDNEAMFVLATMDGTLEAVRAQRSVQSKVAVHSRHG